LITGNIDQAIQYVNSLADRNALPGAQVAYLLRLCTHVSLAMRDLEVPHDQGAANEIIRKYVNILMEYHVVQLAIS
jgi:hypothetical protein